MLVILCITHDNTFAVYVNDAHPRTAPLPACAAIPCSCLTASGILPCMVPPSGIEPLCRVPQTRVLPLNQGGIWVWTSRVRTRCGSEPCAARPLPLVQVVLVIAVVHTGVRPHGRAVILLPLAQTGRELNSDVESQPGFPSSSPVDDQPGISGFLSWYFSNFFWSAGSNLVPAATAQKWSVVSSISTVHVLVLGLTNMTMW